MRVNAVLAAAVAAVADLGGCTDTACREPVCWFGSLVGRQRKQAEQAIRFAAEEVA